MNKKKNPCTDLTINDLVILRRFYLNTKYPFHYFKPSTFVSILHISRRAVYNHFEKLERRGFIRKVPHTCYYEPDANPKRLKLVKSVLKGRIKQLSKPRRD